MIPVIYQFALLGGIIHGEKAFAGPYFVNLSITKRCNMRCVGCFFHCAQKKFDSGSIREGDDLSMSVVDKLCDELPAMGTREVFMTGEGEPLLHTGLLNIVRRLKDAELRVSLFTNGTLLTSKNIDMLLHSGLDVLKISLWAVNSSEHENCHPGVDPGWLEKRIQGIKHLQELKEIRHLSKPEINLNMIINRHNYLNISERLALAAQSGCDSISFAVFRDFGGKFQHLSLTAQEIDDIRPKLRETKRLLKSASVQFNLNDYLAHAEMGYSAWQKIPCYAGWYQASINTRGEVLFCPHCDSITGNINDQPFVSIWNSAEYRTFRRLGTFSTRYLPSRFGCDCANCCITKDNLRVHNRLKWFKPYLALQRSYR